MRQKCCSVHFGIASKREKKHESCDSDGIDINKYELEHCLYSIKYSI